MKLIYINEIGKTFKGYNLYEFLFSDTDDLSKVEGDFWDVLPASGRPNPPYDRFISSVGVLKTEIKLDLIQNSDTFAVWDAQDGIIALGWENILSYDQYPDKRLSFAYGETFESVSNKLYEIELELEIEKFI